MQAALALLLLLGVPCLTDAAALQSHAGAQGYRLYERYDQCDAMWGSDEMGVKGPGERATICREGCAMSCVAMTLATMGITIDGSTTTPGTLNAWLEANQGYHCDGGDCNNLVLDAPERLADGRLTLLSEAPKGSFADITSGIANGTGIANGIIGSAIDKTWILFASAGASGTGTAVSYSCIFLKYGT